MWLKENNKNSIFILIFIFGILVVFFGQQIEGCYSGQYCFTPRNYSGRFVDEELYNAFNETARGLCDGFCHHNSTLRLRCCAYAAKVHSDRISEQVCRYNHLKRGFIIHGKLAKDNEFPFMAALGWRIKDDSTGNSTIVYKCGGTIYDRGYVITAAHCLYHSADLPVVVRPGGFALNDTEAWDLEVEDVIEHPNYEYPSVYNDIAVIRLKAIFNGNPFHDAPACLWAKPSLEENVTAIGYGDTQFGGVSSPLLLKTNLTTINNRECESFYDPDSGALTEGIRSTQICAMDPEKLRDTCQGDSGGPIIKFVQMEGLNLMSYLVGVTSFGIGCGTGTPSVYTRISEFVDWIEEVTYGTVAS
ncbi:trypsin-1-like [Rhagoletis pomonella]|uniref:trypsin-1-like n=1 Tax=Rhagoletis pomonella TaxID=28610 RepID=UPI00178014FD|nr:trypsin-1-like [Rhagoletis pomonella]